MKRFNVSLDDRHAAHLSRLASDLHMQEGTVARSLLAQALDRTAATSDADPGAEAISALLDQIPGFSEGLTESREQIKRGDGIPLDQF